MNNVYLVTLNSAPYVTPFLPYVYGLLRVYAEADPVVAQAYTFKEPFFLPAQPTKIAEKLEQPAVLGLSCYIWNFRRHMKVARLTKARYPQTLVVAGGPQIPDRVEDFFEQHPYVDLLVHGEGERPFQALLRERLAEVPDWSRVPGVSFVRDGQVITTERERLELESLPRSPYLAGYLDHAIALCQALKLEYSAPWETNRGCPYSCTFCDWGSNTMSKIRQFEQERLLAEITFFGQ